MKKLLIAMMGAAFILGACGGADEPAPADEAPVEDEAPAEETPADEEAPEEGAEGDAGEATAGDYDAAAAEASYGNCMGCHGPNMEGGAGPALTGLDYDHILDVIENGATGMPGGLVSGEEAENLAAWIASH
ncbi:c-type cytochrome [Anaerobacillus sp. MEB173]|uniref:cytochrome c n=1 Tax=Anaerobacillus sp. MEB173 TaxID=3383345 RepID=UPI003F92E279